MNGQEDMDFCAVLRSAAREVSDEDTAFLLRSKDDRLRRRKIIRKTITVAAALMITFSVTTTGIYAYIKQISTERYTDYTSVQIVDEYKHSLTISQPIDDSIIPEGWILSVYEDTEYLKFYQVSCDEKIFLIEKSIYSAQNINFIDDGFSDYKPVEVRTGVEGYLFSQDDSDMLIFIDDFYYCLTCFNVETDYLLEFAASLR